MTASAAPWTVTQLNEAVKQTLQGLPVVRVQGEVTGFKPSGGHWYFELKDAGARMRCTVWRTSTARMPFVPKDGDQLLVQGRVDLWVAGGAVSLGVTWLEAAGQGQLYQAYLQLKAKLEAEGLFASDRKLPLPFLPKAVGLVAALHSAGLRDMVRLLHDRYPVRIVVASVKVQGEGSAESVARGIEAMDRSGLVDVIIAGRGGGSIEDLWAFNEERLVRAFAACKTPIISAVGHETDTVLTDLAADWRAPTPTYAAERAVPEHHELIALVADRQQRLRRVVDRQLLADRKDLRHLLTRLKDGDRLLASFAQRHAQTHEALLAAQRSKLAALRQRLTDLKWRLQQAHPLLRLARQQQRVVALRQRLAMVGARIVSDRRQEVDRRHGLLKALSPRAALSRGYGIVRRADGPPLGLAASAKPGQPLVVLLHDGELDCTVDKVRLGG
jgi:exodeoxyribonuclease VII large subunit